MLPAALPVALAGHGAVAAAGTPREPEGEGEVDRGRDGRGPLGRLLRTTSGEDVCPRSAVQRAGAGEQPGDAAQLVGGHPADLLGALGPPGCDGASDGVGPRRAVGEVRLVRETLGPHHVEESEEHHEVGAGHHLEVDAGAVLREARGRAAPGVDDHEPAALAGPGQVLDGRGHGLGDVGAEEEHGLGAAEVGERERQPAVDAEGPVGAGRGARHAEPAVVVDVRGPQDRPCELAEGVRLLVRQPSAAEHGDRVGPVLGGGLPGTGRDEVERLVPGRGVQLAVRSPHERGGDAVRYAEHARARPALLAQPATVRGELPALDDDARQAEVDGPGRCGCSRGDRLQRHRALQRAVGAVGGRCCRGWHELGSDALCGHR